MAGQRSCPWRSSGPAVWSSTGCWPPGTQSSPSTPPRSTPPGPCWSAAGAKSDPGDSYKLADYLRTDGHRLGRLQPLDDATHELQVLVRLREDHVKAKVAASNQLGALLDAHWPGAKQVFSRLASEIALAFLEAYPTPQAAARLSEARLAAFCRRHSYRGGRSAAELLARLRSAPIPPVGIAPEVFTELVSVQVRLLRTLLGTIADLDRALGAGLVGHAKAKLLAPMPRIGEVNLAQIVAEVGPVLDRAATAEQAIAECGAAPVTRASGKTRTVGFRWAANRRARTALHAFADNSRHASPWAAKLYADARRRGKHHPHAIRILARAWLRVIWACWHTETRYDPANHGGEQRLAA
jgi:transposase